jgi:hypothetical protein
LAAVFATTLPCGGVGSAGPTATPWSAGLGRHGGLRIDAGDGVDQFAFGAVTNHDDFALFAAFQSVVTCIESQARLGALRAVTAGAGSVKQRLDILVESQPLLGGRRRKAARLGAAAGVSAARTLSVMVTPAIKRAVVDFMLFIYLLIGLLTRGDWCAETTGVPGVL